MSLAEVEANRGEEPAGCIEQTDRDGVKWTMTMSGAEVEAEGD